MLVALGFLAALVVVMRGARREGVPSEPVLDLGLRRRLLAAIVGSRLLYVLFNLQILANSTRCAFSWSGRTA